MNDLIRIKFDETSDTEPTVSGRELHAALEVNERYTQWFNGEFVVEVSEEDE